MDLNEDSSDNNTTTDKAFQEVEFIKEPVEFVKEFVEASRGIQSTDFHQLHPLRYKIFSFVLLGTLFVLW